MYDILSFLFDYKQEKTKVEKPAISVIYSIFLIKGRYIAVRTTGTRGCYGNLWYKAQVKIPQGCKCQKTLQTNNYLEQQIYSRWVIELRVMLRNCPVKCINKKYRQKTLKVVMLKLRHSYVKHETNFWTSESASVNCYQTERNRKKTSEGRTYFSVKCAEWQENRYWPKTSLALGKLLEEAFLAPTQKYLYWWLSIWKWYVRGYGWM